MEDSEESRPPRLRPSPLSFSLRNPQCRQVFKCIVTLSSEGLGVSPELSVVAGKSQISTRQSGVLPVKGTDPIFAVLNLGQKPEGQVMRKTRRCDKESVHVSLGVPLRPVLSRRLSGVVSDPTLLLSSRIVHPLLQWVPPL